MAEETLSHYNNKPLFCQSVNAYRSCKIPSSRPRVTAMLVASDDSTCISDEAHGHRHAKPATCPTKCPCKAVLARGEQVLVV